MTLDAGRIEAAREALRAQAQRVERMMPQYERQGPMGMAPLGPACAAMLAMMRHDLAAARDAIAVGDLGAMHRVSVALGEYYA